MLSFRDFLLENVYYHGTSPNAASDIVRSGIDPSKSKHGSRIFLTRNHGEASKYAKFASGGKPGVVLRVDARSLDPKRVASDKSGIVQYTGKIDPRHVSRID
jgi:RNA:NAD 2'-phosphotransferase (TPT1/KptA family)